MNPVAPPPAAACAACGAVLREGARFCPQCGAHASGAPPPSNSLHMAPLDPVFSGGLPAALGGYFAALLLMLVVIGTADATITDLRTFGYVLIGIAVVGIGIYHRANLPLLTRWPRLTRRGALAAVGATAVIAAAVLVVRELAPTLFFDEALPYKLLGTSAAFALLDLAVLPAIGEELLFRGVILSGLLGVFGKRSSAIISALLFATLHLSPLSFVHLGLLGYVLARVRLGTNSVWPCVLIHAGYNAVVVLAAW